MSAAFSLVNIGLAEWAIHGLNRDFFIPNLLFLLLIAPTMYVTYMIGKCVKREEDAARLVDPSVLDQFSHSSFTLSKSCILLFEPDEAQASSREASTLLGYSFGVEKETKHTRFHFEVEVAC